jgi:hypothetical protein
MSSLDLEFDLDSRVSFLELEWREAFEASIVARADYHSLASQQAVDLESLDQARERFERCEAHKSHILNKIDRLERRFLGGH